ncbi:MAG TPA: glycosyltransferase [Verrucomicrobiae bacterium]|nr:glycosyltransferase [Verrucomicrobiae bacterium]
MRVLVGIVAHNRADVLPAAIQSALRQSFAGTGVLVYDSGSTDATSALRGNYPHIGWKSSGQNIGCVRARNEMMAEAAVDLYCSLDDDAWFMRDDVLDIAVRLFEKNHRLGALAFDILSPDRPDVVPLGGAVQAGLFIGCGHVLRLSAVREAGYYVESPGFYGAEEKDLCVRLLDLGWEIAKVPGLHVWHEKTPVARDIPAQHRSGVCNDLTFALRRYPLPLVLWVLPGKVLSHLWFGLRHGLLRPCLRGMALFIRHFTEVAVQRNPVSVAAIQEFAQRTKV